MLSADATAEPTDTGSSGFIPIALDTLLPSAAYGFDLYLRQDRGGSPTLYRRNSYPLSKGDIERLVREGVRTLHILYDDRDRYAEYLESLLASPRDFTPAQKYSILKSAARSMLSDTICDRSVDAYVENVETLSQQMVDLVCNDELLMRDMFSLMTHDYYSYTHVTNVSTYCLTLGRHLGINDKSELARLVGGALLHDIGKRHLPREILNKPGKLTPEEMELVRRHPQQGFEELCLRTDLNWAELMMVYQHHERLDGSGYPVQIGGDEMHPWAKICAVADVFDALTSARPYRKPVETGEVLEFFERRSGVAFDAEVVKCLTSLMRQK